MKKIFKKLTIRTITSNFRQFLSVILIVFMSSMLLSGFITNYYMLDRTVDTYFEKTNLADLWLYVDEVSEQDEIFFKENNITYDKRLYFETRADISSGAASNNVKVFVSSGKISNPYVEKWMGSKDCLIDKKVCENNNLEIGVDKIYFTIEINYWGYDIELNLEFLITGTMSFDECSDGYGSWPVFISEKLFTDKVNNCASTILGIPNLQVLQSPPYNQIVIKTGNVEKTSEQILQYYSSGETTSTLNYILDRDSVESVVLLGSEVNQSKKMIYVFPMIFLVVSVLIILTTINQLVLQEKQKIGTLKSIGIPDKIILHHYSKFGAILCLIGTVLGVIFGILVIPSVMFIKYNLVYSIPADFIKFRTPMLLIILVMALIVGLGYLVSYLACYGFLHKKPVELLSYSTGNCKIKGQGKLSKLPFSLKMAMRNIRLKPIRTIMAIIGIAGCVSLLLCGFGITDTLNHSVSHDFGSLFQYDITSTYNNPDFEQQLKELDWIKNYEKYEKLYITARTDDHVKNLNLYKIKQSSLLTSIYMQSDDAFISRSIADEFKIKKGDKIVISLGDVSHTITITKIITTSVMNGIYVCSDYGFDATFTTYGVWIKTNEATPEHIKYLNSINGTNSAYSMEEYMDNIDSKISSINIMTTTLKIFAVSLAVVVLLNLILLILKERVKEIATLKVLGRSMISIVLSLLFEMAIMSVFGTIIGMIFGYPLLVLVLSINKVEILTFLYSISTGSYFLSIAILAVTILFVTLICYGKVRKISMIESLKSVE